MATEELKPLDWVASSKKDLRAMPVAVKSIFGFALYQAQIGEKHADAKPLRGFGGAGVLEVVENHQGGTYRAVYTVKFEEAVYVLHCFQKRSKSGAATPRQDLELIKSRLTIAREEHKKWQEKKK